MLGCLMVTAGWASRLIVEDACRPDDMVVAAIISLQSPIGSHTDDILHWIEVRGTQSWSPLLLGRHVVSIHSCMMLHKHAPQEVCVNCMCSLARAGYQHLLRHAMALGAYAMLEL